MWPAYAIDKLTHQHGFYASGVVYSAAIVLLALRVLERPDRVRVGLFGLVAGLACWQTTQIVPVLVPVVSWLAWRRPQALRHLVLALPLAVLGGLPSIVWMFHHGLLSLGPPVNHATYLDRLRVFVSPTVPMALGLRIPDTQQPVVLSAAFVDVAYMVIVALFACTAVRVRRSDGGLLVVILLAFPFLYAISPSSAHAQDPVYLTVLVPVLALLLGRIAGGFGRAWILVAVAGALSLVGLFRLNDWARPVPQGPLAPRNIDNLISTLDRLHVDRVYADHWLAYVLVYDTNERIIAAENLLQRVRFVDGRAIAAHKPTIRWPAYEREVNAAPARGFVFFRETLAKTPIVAPLVQHGYCRHTVGMFLVLAPPGSPGCQPT